MHSSQSKENPAKPSDAPEVVSVLKRLARLFIEHARISKLPASSVEVESRVSRKGRVASESRDLRKRDGQP